jgi:hypothetical protein
MSQQLLDKMLQGGVVAALKQSGSLDAPIALKVRSMSRWRWVLTPLAASDRCCIRSRQNRPSPLTPPPPLPAAPQVTELKEANGKFKVQFTDGKENLAGVLTSQVRVRGRRRPRRAPRHPLRAASSRPPRCRRRRRRPPRLSARGRTRSAPIPARAQTYRAPPPRREWWP